MIFGHQNLHSSLTDHHRQPDWRNAAEYAYLDGRAIDQIAWEFLRRNEAYRQAFFEWLPGWQAWWRPLVGCGPPPPDVDEGCTALCERFGLSDKFGPHHPASIMMPVFADRHRPNIQILGRWINGVKLDFYDPPPADCLNSFEVRVVADRPLEEQIDRIRIIYDEMLHGIKQPKAPKLTPGKYTTYLRILDGLESGAGMPEIAQTLYPLDGREAAYDRVKKQKAKALNLTDRGYLDLVRPLWR